MPQPDDPVAAELARLSEGMIAAANVLLPGLDPKRAFAAGALHACALKALAAAEAPLKLHSVVPWYCAASDCDHPEPEDDMSDEWQDWDDNHVTGSGGILVCLLTQIGSLCPECTRLAYGTEEPEDDGFVSAPCNTRSAVLAELTGKGKADA